MAPDDKTQTKIDAANEILDQMPEEARAKMFLDNEGNLVTKNRAYRRAKQPTPPQFTKKTQKKRKKRNGKK